MRLWPLFGWPTWSSSEIISTGKDFSSANHKIVQWLSLTRWLDRLALALALVLADECLNRALWNLMISFISFVYRKSVFLGRSYSKNTSNALIFIILARPMIWPAIKIAIVSSPRCLLYLSSFVIGCRYYIQGSVELVASGPCSYLGF